MASPLPRMQTAHMQVKPVSEVLTAVAVELERLRVLGLRIEGAICGFAVRGPLDSEIVGELQQLDAIIQHIAALRDFSATLSQSVDQHSVVPIDDALNHITLAALRARLSLSDADDDDGAWEML